MKKQEHLILAALLHDIGKFFERAELLGEYRNDAEQEQQDCPKAKEGYRSHKHVLHTHRFCEILSEHVHFLRPEEYQRNRQADQHWINLAVRHHVSGTPLEKIVMHADHLASAEREKGNYYEKRVHQKTYLESMLERVNLQGQNKETKYRLPLEEGIPETSCVFPAHRNTLKLEAKTNEYGQEIWLSPKLVQDKYAKLAQSMLHDLKSLPQQQSASPQALRSTITSLLALFKRYLVQVPAATNVVHADISLFDHLRVTAAITEGLFWHHEARNELENTQAILQEETPKWRLICGDFSGIQSFIFRITSKGAANALRGRSLYIQLLCDAVSEHLLRKLGLFPTARIYSSGGKFYLLIADVLEEPLRKAVDEVNAWLFKEFGGEVFLGLGVATVCAADFQGGKMSEKWREANDDLAKNRLQRFSSQMNAYFFAPISPLKEGSHCHVCGRNEEGIDLKPEENRSVCKQCRQLENLGKNLADTSYLFWTWEQDRKIAHDLSKTLHCQTFPEPLNLDIYFLKNPPDFSVMKELPDSHLEKLNQQNCLDGNLNGYACSVRWLGKWERDKDSGKYEFDQFAENAEGLKRLGVLRMDVDNLGQMFMRGFKWDKQNQEEMGSLSRVATLSRQLDLFFSAYLPQLLRNFEKVQIIYAGGDDLFLLGSWNELPEAARQIQQEFSVYCTGNPDIGISGGMSLIRGKFPISRAAELAGEAEKTAKMFKRKNDQNGLKKNAFRMLETTIGWEDFEALKKLRDLLLETMEKDRSILSRMRKIVAAHHKHEQLLHRRDGLNAQQIAEMVRWGPWRWQMVYNLSRLSKRDGSLKETIEALQNAILNNQVSGDQTTTDVLDWLQLPTRWAEFLKRRS
ncbi:MAG: type III-A CRISPR-associated protein Cas10/Csm1 [Candidatus Thioglobus sp.]|nr:type III-A CRISPR-associated protein Cas10/Csm1 [Candidatus Thioglobus sp.]